MVVLNSNEDHLPSLVFSFLYIQKKIILSPSYFYFTFQDCYSLYYSYPTGKELIYMSFFYRSISLYCSIYFCIIVHDHTDALSFLSQCLKSLLGLALLFYVGVCNINQECCFMKFPALSAILSEKPLCCN